MNIFFALCAVIGGSLRILASFIPYKTSSDSLQLLYIIIDINLILALVGYYLAFSRQFRTASHIGIIVSLIGFSLIAGPEATIFGIGIYQIGSAIIGLGLIIFASEHLLQKINNKIMALCFLTSVLIGLLSMLLNISILLSISGVLLGLAFILMGITLKKATL